MALMNISRGGDMGSDGGVGGGGGAERGGGGIGDSYSTWSSSSSSSSSSSVSAAAAFDGLTSLHTTGRAELYIVMAILILLSLTGTAGNALVMYVFSQKKDKLVSTLFILILALVDFVTCLVVIPYTMYMEYVDFKVDSDLVCKLYQFLITSNIPFSAFIMVAIAVDRYFCICHPFLQAMTVFRAKFAVAVLALLAAGIGVCVSLMYGVYSPQDGSMYDGGNSSVLYQDSQHLSTDGVSFDAATVYGGFDEDTSSSYSVFGGGYSDELDVEGDADRYVVAVNTGSCEPNELVVTTKFQYTFQKCYTALYLLCLIVVAFLYVLIYRSVLDRRTRRQNAKSKSLSLVLATGQCRRQCCPDGEDTLFTTVEVEGPPAESHRNGGKQGKVRGRDDRDQARASISIATKRDLNRMANLKTAAMLFVVTVVFVVTFLPAFLMALQLIPYNMTIFYMYFANNVANPVIYSFMNKNFRDDTKRLLCR